MKRTPRISTPRIVAIILLATGCLLAEDSTTFELTRDQLLDKIKGGWAGQVIGCSYGGPVEFKFPGTLIQDYQPIEWDETLMEHHYDLSPGLYDDIYMDLTFVEVIEREGQDAPAQSHADAFANAGYKLWHANQAARYNILNGIPPPASGHWENNPHADDIDFQIEADFAGLMSPGLPNHAAKISDRVGHIMNYGDGWYGGVYVAAMYSYAFCKKDVADVVKSALEIIPPESEFHQCISDVIRWHQQYPDNWKQTWFECEVKWSSDVGCPRGVFDPFNIDAKINAAYVVIGLLYGNGDYGRTIDIATRCGQDADCNPATAAGVLGTILGYSHIPEFWKQGLDRVEDRNFSHTDLSLNDIYVLGLKHALQSVELCGGTVDGNHIRIPIEEPKQVALEKSFEGHFPVQRIMLGGRETDTLSKKHPEYSFEFEGIGFAVMGFPTELGADFILTVNVYLDGELIEAVRTPANYLKRRQELAWKYRLPRGKHQVRLEYQDPDERSGIALYRIVTYDDKPREPIHSH